MVCCNGASSGEDHVPCSSLGITQDLYVTLDHAVCVGCLFLHTRSWRTGAVLKCQGKAEGQSLKSRAESGARLAPDPGPGHGSNVPPQCF